MYDTSDDVPPPLYSRVQRLYIRSGSAQSEVQKDVRLTVDLVTSLSKVSKQVLRIQVTDDEDPYFLYSLLITEEDYQHLRSSQGLLVDFHNFPTQTVKLFEQCDSDTSSQRFLLLLEEDNGRDSKPTLKVIEANNFVHLCYLHLNVEKGNDADIKKLMQKKIRQLKDKTSKDGKYISELEAQLADRAAQLETKVKELMQVKRSWDEERMQFKCDSSKELTVETEKLRRSQVEWKAKMQKEWAESEDKYLTAIREKDSEISKLRNEAQLLAEKLSHVESTTKEQSRRIEGLEKDLTTTRWEVSSAKKQNAKLDADYHEKEKQVNSLRTKLAVAEQELKDKSSLMAKQQELLASAQEQKSRIEEALSDRDRQLTRRQTSLQSITDELVKANEIITKLQKELGVTTAKLKVRTGIAIEQEKVVEALKKRVDELEACVVSRNKKIDSLEASEKLLKKSVEEYRDMMEMRDKTIQDNERVIAWLNKRVDEAVKEATASSVKTVSEPSPATSTPFSHLVSDVVNPANQSYSALYTAASRIDPEVQEITSPPDPPLQKTPACAVMTPPTTASSKQDQPKQNKAKGVKVGFKRATINQTSAVPSSYFLK